MTTESPHFRELITNAVKYWEPRRLAYNGVLAAVVAVCFFLNWPESKAALSFDSALGLFILAVLANVAYCAAYLPDLMLQYSSLREGWLKWRFLLFWLGILFAAALTYLFAYTTFYADA